MIEYLASSQFGDLVGNMMGVVLILFGVVFLLGMVISVLFGGDKR